MQPVADWRCCRGHSGWTEADLYQMVATILLTLASGFSSAQSTAYPSCTIFDACSICLNMPDASSQRPVQLSSCPERWKLTQPTLDDEPSSGCKRSLFLLSASLFRSSHQPQLQLVFPNKLNADDLPEY